jgi:hypothetical protein
MPQLAKQHRDELAPAAEAADVALGLALPDGSLELQPRHELQHLRKIRLNPFMAAVPLG